MKSKIARILGIIIIVAGVAFGGYGLKRCWDEETAGKEYEQLREDVVLDLPDEELQEEKEEEPKEVVIPIDFDELVSKYPDVYAWIRIPGTKIDYPIAQKQGDNEYYLKHNIDGTRRVAGAIYTEDYNSKDFTDPNTIIYGHNMRNGSMFKQLHKFRDKKFFSEHTEILIYQPNRILHYKVFAAYVYDNRHILRSFDFSNEFSYGAYLSEIFRLKGRMGYWSSEVNVTTADKILTLSTCTGNDSQRYLVQGVLLSIEEKQ